MPCSPYRYCDPTDPGRPGETGRTARLDGAIEEVVLSSQEEHLAHWSEPPYTFDWREVSIGDYELKARALEPDGNEVTSEAVPIRVLNPDGAYETRWRVHEGNWEQSGNWSLRVPTARDTAIIDNGGEISVERGAREAHRYACLGRWRGGFGRS